MISVIIPIYNSEKYLSYCIESVLKQTYKDIEVILVDDGSTDGSKQICKKYLELDNRVKYHYKDNAGVSEARNYGIKEADGDYIAFLDSDDFLDENMLKILHTKMQTADFAMCGYQLYDSDADNNIISYSCSALEGEIADLAYNIENYLSPPLLLGPCFKLFKRTIITSNNIFFPPELSYGEDAVFVFEYLMHCDKIGFDSYIGYYYRQHGKESLSTRFLEDKIDINYRINQLIHSFIKKYGLDPEKITKERMTECFTAYTKELIATPIPILTKMDIFYDRFIKYESYMAPPSRFAQKLVYFAGRHKFFFFTMYLFKIKRR